MKSRCDSDGNWFIFVPAIHLVVLTVILKDSTFRYNGHIFHFMGYISDLLLIWP